MSAFQTMITFSPLMTWVSIAFQMIHKSYLEVNEEGSEAAATTVIQIALNSMSLPVILDHPFMFVIRDNRSKAVVFCGRIYFPEQFSETDEIDSYMQTYMQDLQDEKFLSHNAYNTEESMLQNHNSQIVSSNMSQDASPNVSLPRTCMQDTFID